MLFPGASALRVLRSGPGFLQKCQKVNNCIIILPNFPVRPHSVSSAPLRQKPIYPTNIFVACGGIPRRRCAEFDRLLPARTYASARVIRRFEDLPRNYKDENGLRFRATPMSKEEVAAIFGHGIDVGAANRALRIIHGRRVAGTLVDPSLKWPTGTSYDKRVNAIALSWLRKNVPMDEEYAAGKRAEIELEAMEAEMVADSERLGLYRPNSGVAAKGRRNGNSIYGESGLDAIKKAREERLQREEQERELARKLQADEARQNTGTLSVPNSKSSVELRGTGMHPRLKYYLDRAKVLPDVPPEMSAWQRLWPSGLVALLVIGLSIGWTQIYIPPPRAARLWPDVPPAAATVLALVLMNAAVFAAWHVPPAFRLLNKYFIVVPGYPRALAILGSIFSQQTINHLCLNMVVLWFMGTSLHDDVGRANFLAMYLSSGVFASFASLAAFTFRRQFITSSLGASGSVAGIVAAFLWIHGSDCFKILGLPPDPLPGVSGLGFLIPIILVDTIGLRRMGKTGWKYDNYAHLGGYFTGIIGGEIWKRRAAERKRIELEGKNAALGADANLP